jgi:L-rhamnonate dehydratase
VKITAIEPIIIRSHEIDSSRADGTQDAFLVKVCTDEGLVGIGEADSAPYLMRTIFEMPSSHSVSRGLNELLVGQDPLQIRRLWDLMFSGSYHYGRDGAALHAMSAIDMALWDLAGKAAGRPVSELLGGRRADAVEAYASEVMPETPEEVSEIARRAVTAGFNALKLGWGPLGRDVGRDVELVCAARETLGPGRRLMIDGGLAYSVKSAREFCHRVADLDLYWFEEPFAADDLVSYRRLSDYVDIRIASGEGHSTLRPYQLLIDEAHVDVLQPDLGRCGGFTTAAEIVGLARLATIQVVPHCFSTDVLLAASLQFSSTLADHRLVEHPITASVEAGSIVVSPPRAVDGLAPVPMGPGLGIELDEDEIDRRRVR